MTITATAPSVCIVHWSSKRFKLFHSLNPSKSQDIIKDLKVKVRVEPSHGSFEGEPFHTEKAAALMPTKVSEHRTQKKKK